MTTNLYFLSLFNEHILSKNNYFIFHLNFIMYITSS